MNAGRTLGIFALLVFGSADLAFAAVNNVNSRGQFVPMGSNLSAGRQSYSRPARPSYSRPARPAYVMSAPATAATVAPVVAAAPTEVRRFSYDPSTAAPAAPVVTAGSPCPTGTAPAPATSGRRFSYDPSAGATVTPAPAAAPRVYSTQPSYSGRSRSSSSNLERWQIPKTDPRKYLTN